MTVFVTDPASHLVGDAIGNLGDLIIREAIQRELQGIGMSPTWIAYETRVASGRLAIGGANVVGNLPFIRRALWNPGPALLGRNRATLFGVGWWKYQRRSDPLTALTYRRVLSSDGLHSVRDGYTLGRLNAMGIHNVLNTACPTVWRLGDCIDQRWPDDIVVTITDYSRDSQRDLAMLRHLQSKGFRLALWPQGTEDSSYFTELCELDPALRSITILDRSLAVLDQRLKAGAGFVGTRLHSGIRSLQHGRPTIVVAIDNRAIELGKDVGIPIAPRGDLAAIDRLLKQAQIELKLPREQITSFLDAFATTFRAGIASPSQPCTTP
ncbi:MAG TPA: polysaccharide pyruvyl transferase family protein [Rhodocyclaceae bacterium]